MGEGSLHIHASIGSGSRKHRVRRDTQASGEGSLHIHASIGSGARSVSFPTLSGCGNDAVLQFTRILVHPVDLEAESGPSCGSFFECFHTFAFPHTRILAFLTPQTTGL